MMKATECMIEGAQIKPQTEQMLNILFLSN